tara:strand:- start:12094 stop:13290 length:1197 start_codon:yes stop_codon:yes gene_type:complete
MIVKSVHNIIKVLWISCLLQACSSDGYVPEEPATLNTFKQVMEAKVDWSETIGSGVGDYYSRLNPAIGYGKYFAADRYSKVMAFDEQSGDVVWQTKILDVIEKAPLNDVNNARLASGLTVGYKKVFVGSEHGLITALDAETGRLLWSQKLAGELLSKPVLALNKVVVHAASGIIYAFDVETGKKVWDFYSALPALTLRGTSEPVAEYGAIIFGTAEGKLVVLDAQTGLPAWMSQLTVPQGTNDLERIRDIDAKVLVVDQSLYVLGFNGHLVSLNVRDGKVIWKRNYSGLNNLAVQGNTLFLTDARDNVISVDRQTGKELWRNKNLTLRQLTAPAVINGVVVVGDFEGYVHALDARTGAFVARVRADSHGLLGQPIVTDDKKFLFQSRDGDIARVVVKQ